MSTLTIPTDAIQTVIASVIASALGGSPSITYDWENSRAWSPASDISVASPQVLVIWRQPERTGEWTPRIDTYRFPFSIYVLRLMTDDSDMTSQLNSDMGAIVSEIDALGNRWSGVTDMHRYKSLLGKEPAEEAAWRQAGFATKQLDVEVLCDYKRH